MHVRWFHCCRESGHHNRTGRGKRMKRLDGSMYDLHILGSFTVRTVVISIPCMCAGFIIADDQGHLRGQRTRR